jgi:hypothetical protein
VDASQFVEPAAYSNTITEKVGFARSLYIPLDNNCLIYTNPNLVTAANCYGMWQFAASGMLAPSTSGGTHEIIITENFECIPVNSSTSIITATPSKSDPFEMAVAANALSAAPHIATAVTTKEAATAGAETVSMAGPRGGTLVHSMDPQSGENRPGLMDRFLSGIEGTMSVAKKAAPFAAPLLALL